MSPRWNRSGANSARAELDELLLDLEANDRGASTPLEAVKDLTGERSIWWECCRQSVRHDPTWLRTAKASAVPEFIDEKVTEPGDRSRAIVDAMRLTLCTARVLSGPPGALPSADLAYAVERWGDVQVLPPTPVGAELFTPAGRDMTDDDLRRRLAAVIDALPGDARDPARAMVALTALLLVADKPKERRFPVRISAVFGRPGQDEAEQGAAGTLELHELVGGPPGIFPDPRFMSGIRGSESFVESIALAWNTSPGQRGGRCVLWRLTIDGAPVSSVQGPSLGAAFALALRELLRRPISSSPSAAWVRYLFRRFFSGLRPRTAITGAIDERDQLRWIGHIGAKFLAAHNKGWRLVAPQANADEIGSAPDPDAVHFAADLDEARKYTRRVRTDRAVGGVAALTVAALLTYAVYALTAGAASQQHTADRLANLSKSLLGSDLRLAQLFAVQAYHTVADSQTKSALFNAVTSSPHFVRSFDAGEQVTAVTSSGNGKTALVGTRNGSVLSWNLASGKRTTLLRLASLASKISADATADAVIVLAGKTADLWVSGEPPTALRMPTDQEPTGVGISPSGRFVLVATSDAPGGLNTPSRLVLFDRNAHTSVSITLPDSDIETIAVPDETQMVGFEGAYGGWQRRSLPSLTLLAGAVAGFGTHNYATALSPSGTSFSYSNNGDSLPIWTTDKTPSSPGTPQSTVPTRGNHATALAISGDGARVAQASDNIIYVTNTKPDDTTPPEPVALTGTPGINAGALGFVGDHDHLISASGASLTLWNLHQYARITDTKPLNTPLSCNACSAPLLATQPAGQDVAVVDGNGVSLNVSDPTSPVMSLPSASIGDQTYAAPLWSRNGRQLIVISPADDSVQVRSPAAGLYLEGQWPPPVPAVSASEDPVAYAQATPDGRRLIEVKSSGTLEIRDMRNGGVIRTVAGPRDMAPSDGGANLTPSARVAVDAHGEHTAVIDDVDDAAPTVVVTDVGSGVSRSIVGAKPTGIAFLGPRLLIQRGNGALEIRDSSSTTLQRTIDGDAENIVGPVVDGGNTIAEERPDGTVTVIDVHTGDTLGRLTLPTPYKYAKTGMAFSSDGRTLVTVTESQGADPPADGPMGQLIRWRFTPHAWTAAACAASGRQLTQSEWRQYVGSSNHPDLTCRA